MPFNTYVGIDLNGNKITSEGTRLLYYPGGDYQGTLILGTAGDSLTGSVPLQGEYNTLLGIDSGLAITTGYQNTSIGHSSLKSLTSGNTNTGVGYLSLSSLTTGASNAAIGTNTLGAVTSGSNNIAIGWYAGGILTTGNNNIYIGNNVNSSSTSVTNEIVIGSYLTGNGANTVKIGTDSSTKTEILGSLGIGTSNPAEALDVVGNIQLSGVIKNSDGTASNPSYTFSSGTGNGMYLSGSTLGWSTAGLQQMTLDSIKLAVVPRQVHVGGVRLVYLPSGLLDSSVFYGNGGSSISHTTGSEGYYNTAVGISAMSDITTGSHNTSVGNNSLGSVTTGTTNTAIGSNTAQSLTVGYSNTIVGYASLTSATSGAFNIAIGDSALYNLTTSDSNVAIGKNAGRYYGGTTNSLLTPSNSIFIGESTYASADGNTNEIVIGYNALGNGSNTVTIGNTSITDNYFNGDVRTTGGVLLGNTSSTDDGFIRWTGTDFEGRKSGTWVSLTTSSSGGVGGSGTTNYYPIWDAAGDLTDGYIYYNTNHNRSTSKFAVELTDSSTLDYTGDGLTLINLSSTNNTWMTLMFAEVVGANQYGAIGLKKDDTTNIYGSLHFATKGSSGFGTRMSISNSGNVGIGTTSPSYKLEVSGQTDVDVLSVKGLDAIKYPTGTSDVLLLGDTDVDASGTYTNVIKIGTTILENSTNLSNSVYIGKSIGGTSTTSSSTSQVIGHSIASNLYPVNCTIIGYGNLISGSGTVSGCVVLGFEAGRLVYGDSHVLIGYRAGRELFGYLNLNVFIGSEAGRHIASGSNLTTASKCVIIGPNARAGENNTTNEIVIGYNAYGNGSNTATIGNDSITKTILKGSVGIGTTSPSDKLHVSGSFRAGGAVRVNHTTLSANTTLDETTHYIVGVSTISGSVTITLPASPVIGRTYIIYKSESSINAVTVSGNGNNINGAANYTLNNAYDKVHIVYNGAEWIII